MEGNTAIVNISNSNYLELVFNCSSRFWEYANVLVTLDKRMIPTPSNKSNSPSLSLSGISMSDNRDYATYKDSQSININFFELPLRYRLKNDIRSKRIHFKWVSSDLPRKIRIKVVITNKFKFKHEIILNGICTQDKAIHLLMPREDSSFYFGHDSNVITTSYWNLMREVESLQNSALKPLYSMTYPLEHKFWMSKQGGSMVRSQVKRTVLRASHGALPKRILVDPIKLDASEEVKTNIVREMEVHSRLGVAIYVASPNNLGKTGAKLGASYCIFEDSLSMNFRDVTQNDHRGGVEICFDMEKINRHHLIHKEILDCSIPWSKYKRNNELYLDDEESYFYIKNRYHSLVT